VNEAYPDRESSVTVSVSDDELYVSQKECLSVSGAEVSAGIADVWPCHELKTTYLSLVESEYVSLLTKRTC
jgi:hypothetical protein